ncbi:MAG: hypothetical protein HC794_09500 [Nitrospiraceae bacterium]|nr:hypothetical protein [Nitrospiraceae bacterium]
MLLRISFNLKGLTRLSRPVTAHASLPYAQPQDTRPEQTVYDHIATGNALADAEDAANRLWLRE